MRRLREVPVSFLRSASPKLANPSYNRCMTVLRAHFDGKVFGPDWPLGVGHGSVPGQVWWCEGSDGGLLAVRGGDAQRPRGDGVGGVSVGDTGFVTYETYGNQPKVYPEAAAARAEQVPKSVPRIDVSHEANWAAASKGHGTASSPFAYAARITETMLLGVSALRPRQGRADL